MKFKQSIQQNQRIERITSDHLIIGIDIAKFTHVARATDYRGIEQGSYLAFSNDLAGFERLHQWMQSLRSLCHKSNALVIADMIKNGYYTEANLQSEPYCALRQLVTTREFINKQMSAVVNQLHRWTDIYFPEFRSVFKDITKKTALATLAQFPHPSQLCHLTEDEVIAGWKKDMKRAGSRQVARDLIQAAKHTAAIPGIVKEATLSLALLLQQYQLFRTQLDQLEHELSQHVAAIPASKVLRTIKGFHDVTLAIVYSEAGD
ncbi:hypothetical protein ACFOQM_00030 [Paenibacillus sp. GCM10012307]|uniref:Uncharacterized protein n=1 Tax=Paenibacillus roseus TaxID=2798579 RepID=A0A934J1H3_9BACL|nr:hypothetical protein [Paenibacillus roseus]MBJ6359718.1 hypothetical protein [Paenibacillus roseus]